jgi:hypothetical protein
MNIYTVTQKNFNKTNEALSLALGVEYTFIEIDETDMCFQQVIPWNKGKKGLQVAWNKGLTGTKGKPVSQEKRDAISKKLMGHSVSDETRKKMSEKKRGKAPPNKGLKYPILKCPHCEVSGASNMMKRYHFNKCVKGINSK